MHNFLIKIVAVINDKKCVTYQNQVYCKHLKAQTSCRLVCVVRDSCQREARTDGGGIPVSGWGSSSS